MVPATFVKIFPATDPITLETNVNAFLASSTITTLVGVQYFTSYTGIQAGLTIMLYSAFITYQ